MIRLLVVDDQALVRQGLAALLSLYDDFAVVGEAENGEEAVRLAQSLQPDVVLMDLSMPVKDGVKATAEIAGACPQTKILVLTTYDDDDCIVKALRAGACAYLFKDCQSQDVAAAIRSVYHGFWHLGPGISDRVIACLTSSALRKKASPKEMFTARQLEVLQLLCQGKSTSEIARSLAITPRTVNNHVSQILGQLNVRDRTQAALWARQNLD